MADPTGPVRIERDLTFSRHLADVGFAYSVYGGLELVFLAIGPELSEDVDDTESDRRAVYAKESRSEVARIRISTNRAVSLALDMLREAMLRPGFKADALKDDLEALIKEIASERDKDSPESEERS